MSHLHYIIKSWYRCCKRNPNINNKTPQHKELTSIINIMGCASSSSAAAVQERNQNQLSDVMQMAMQMQQQMVEKQQQMTQDDPECKHLMERQMALQQKFLAATQTGDQSAMTQTQSEMLELSKHPKYMKVMTQTMSTMMTAMNTPSAVPVSFAQSNATASKNSGINIHTSTMNSGAGAMPMGAATNFPGMMGTGGMGTVSGATLGGDAGGSMFSEMHGNMNSGGGATTTTSTDQF